MSLLKENIRKWQITKDYVESQGYELGSYIFKTKQNVVLEDVHAADGYKKIIGFISMGSREILKRE